MKKLSPHKSGLQSPKRKLLLKPLTKTKSVIPKENINITTEFEAKLKTGDPEIRHYLDALAVENLTLQKKLAKCRAEHVTLMNQIAVLTEEFGQYKHDNPPFDYSKNNERIKQLDAEIKKLEATGKK
jgi:hypothetical protein